MHVHPPVHLTRMLYFLGRPFDGRAIAAKGRRLRRVTTFITPIYRSREICRRVTDSTGEFRVDGQRPRISPRAGLQTIRFTPAGSQEMQRGCLAGLVGYSCGLEHVVHFRHCAYLAQLATCSDRPSVKRHFSTPRLKIKESEDLRWSRFSISSAGGFCQGRTGRRRRRTRPARGSRRGSGPLNTADAHVYDIGQLTDVSGT